MSDSRPLSTLPVPPDLFEFACEVTRAHAEALLLGSPVGVRVLRVVGDWDGADTVGKDALGGGIPRPQRNVGLHEEPS